MRRFLKLLARLYPAEWRRRYGAEYEALLEEGKPRVRDLFDVLWGAFKMQMTMGSFVRIVLVCSLCGALAAVAISFTRPKTYMSQTVISVDTTARSIDRVLLREVEDALADSTVTSIIQTENLYPRERARMPLNDVVFLVKKNIMLRPEPTGGGKVAFVVQFIYPDPQVAQRVDKRLVSELMAANLRARLNDPSGPSMTFTVRDAADLPQKPFFPRRGVFGVGGLLVGLVGGLIVAAVVGWRRRVTVANG